MSIRTMTVATAATLLLGIGAANAVDTGVPSKPWAGGVCIKYTVGSNIYAFNASDSSYNMLGRLTALNDAAINGYTVQVSVASELAPPYNVTGKDRIDCNDGTEDPFLTPSLVLPK